jgi:hypothetical protein
MATKRKPTTQAKAAVQTHETDEVRKGKSALASKTKAKQQKREPAMSPEEEKALLRLLAILETGFLATMADGVIEPSEFDNLGANFAIWLDQDLTGDDLREILEGFLRHLKEDGIDGRLSYLAQALDNPSRRVAFDFAAMLSACDGDVAEEELGMLEGIADAFEIPKKEAQRRFNEMCRLVLSDE